MAQRVVKFGNRMVAALPGLGVKVAATSKGKSTLRMYGCNLR